jgi:beta-aspartyl-peptidase (threonine type)
MAAILAAREAAWSVMAGGGSSLDAVVAACRVMEDSPALNAGVGSALTREGHVEVDAIVMRGADLGFGAVGAVRGVRHATALARLVMTETPHAFLVSDAALALATAHGLAVSPASLLAAPRAVDAVDVDVSDTVGALAIDHAGRTAAATSTGGIEGKWSGRVGDSPVPGAGAYADDRAGAVSCTGQGEHILRVCMAFQAHLALRSGAATTEAVRSAVAALTDDTPGLGGLIALDMAGRPAWAYNTRAMPVAWRTGSAEHAAEGDAFAPSDP